MCVEVSLAGIYGRSLYIQHVQQWYVPEFSTKHRKHEQINNAARGAISDSSKDYFRCCFYYVNTSMMIRSTIQWIAASLLLREYQHDDTIQWIAAPKLTEIVEVENETWQGAKFGVC